MDTDEQILEYLSSKENLSFALEISNLTERIRERIQRQFWEHVEESLKGYAEETPDL